ncbi:Retinol dehydrogenase 8 [Desmophyllum pertusum]|uniref:Retinol dehydrogenase 8 n=1 Tax=Desmophyllum pertusum TaxID=174260 RepID=A0A9W9ZGH3_9CNID|nr:Retinol dehydrogenase 8 [Desmophyllum pertusum]
MNLAFALPLAEDPLSKFKVLVTMPSLSSSEYLADPRVLNLLNKTLFVLQMDIESDQSINGVLREIMDNDGFIDAVVITSNVLLNGQLETHTIDQARTIFDVNTFVVIKLVMAVLPLMKKQRDGRLIIVSNQAGILGIPFHDIYCASKFAVEGFMECIAPECLAFNIHCSIIETSMIKGEEKTAQTLQVSIRSKMENTDDDTKKYQDSISGKMRRQGSVKKIDLRRVAELIRVALVEERPHFRYQLNKSSKDAAKEKWVDVHGDSNILTLLNNFCALKQSVCEKLWIILTPIRPRYN